jgi:hypothetical protein
VINPITYICWNYRPINIKITEAFQYFQKIYLEIYINKIIIVVSFKNKVLTNPHSFRKCTCSEQYIATEERPFMVFFIQDDSAGKRIFSEVIISVIVRKNCSYEHVSNLEWSRDRAF